VSADSEHPMGGTSQDLVPGLEMAALPAADGPDWDEDDSLPGWDPGVSDPCWDSAGAPPDIDDPDDGRAQGAMFAEGGWADGLAPDPVLATLVDLVQRDGLGKLDDDQLTGVLQAANRLAAWSAAVRIAAVSGLAARREAAARESGDWRPFDHVDDEVAVALTLTRRGAGRLVDLAMELDRLPLTRAALAAGQIDERRAEVIAEECAGLDDAHAAAVEKLIIGRAPKLTSGQLRAVARRAVLAADPAAARRRKEKALKDARVEMFPETSGTAALAGRDLPPAAVLAADRHLTALAQALHAARIPGTLDTLRARAYLHLLSGQPAGTLILQAARPGRPHREPPGSTHIPPAPAAAPGGAAPGGAAPGGAISGGPAPGGPAPGGSAPGGPAPGGSAPGGGRPGLRGTVNLTMPLSAWLGWTQSPGDIPGYGPLDASDSRTLADLLAHDPASQWCVTLTGPAGHPLAHACTRHGPPGPPGPRARAGPTRSRPPGSGCGPGTTPVPDWLSGLTFTTLHTTTCTHERQSRGYRPSPSLRHLIEIRNPACTGPGCRRPATRCDLDHVIPHDQGGRTCECNLHPACKS
jgi:Domain of unknown function (DUF222)